MAFDKFVDCARLSMDDRTKIRSLFADKATDFWGEPGRLHLSALEASYFDRFVDLPGDLHEDDGIDELASRPTSAVAPIRSYAAVAGGAPATGARVAATKPGSDSTPTPAVVPPPPDRMTQQLDELTAAIKAFGAKRPRGDKAKPPQCHACKGNHHISVCEQRFMTGCWLCGSADHAFAHCPSKPGKKAEKTAVKCFSMGRMDHVHKGVVEMDTGCSADMVCSPATVEALGGRLEEAPWRGTDFKGTAHVGRQQATIHCSLVPSRTLRALVCPGMGSHVLLGKPVTRRVGLFANRAELGAWSVALRDYCAPISAFASVLGEGARAPTPPAPRLSVFGSVAVPPAAPTAVRVVAVPEADEEEPPAPAVGKSPRKRAKLTGKAKRAVRSARGVVGQCAPHPLARRLKAIGPDATDAQLVQLHETVHDTDSPMDLELIALDQRLAAISRRLGEIRKACHRCTVAGRAPALAQRQRCHLHEGPEFNLDLCMVANGGRVTSVFDPTVPSPASSTQPKYVLLIVEQGTGRVVVRPRAGTDMAGMPGLLQGVRGYGSSPDRGVWVYRMGDQGGRSLRWRPGGCAGSAGRLPAADLRLRPRQLWGGGARHLHLAPFPGPCLSPAGLDGQACVVRGADEQHDPVAGHSGRPRAVVFGHAAPGPAGGGSHQEHPDLGCGGVAPGPHGCAGCGHGLPAG